MSTDNTVVANTADKPLTTISLPPNSKPKRRGRRRQLLSANTLLSIFQSALINLEKAGVHYEIKPSGWSTDAGIEISLPGVKLCSAQKHLIATEPCEECEREKSNE